LMRIWSGSYTDPPSPSLIRVIIGFLIQPDKALLGKGRGHAPFSAGRAAVHPSGVASGRNGTARLVFGPAEAGPGSDRRRRGSCLT
jgi:hypothetical protein